MSESGNGGRPVNSLYEQLSVLSEKGINGKPINLFTEQLSDCN